MADADAAPLFGDDLLSGAVPADDGSRVSDFRVDGMTTTIVNPNFLVLRERYAQLIRQTELHARVLALARTWTAEMHRTPPFGCASMAEYSDRLVVTEEEVATVIMDATYVFKPPDVADERNNRIRNQLIAAVNPTIAKFRAERLAGKANADKVRDMVVSSRFYQAVREHDWRETPLTTEELLEVFFRYLDYTYDGDNSAEPERRRYVKATVDAAPVTLMYTEWLDAWIAANAATRNDAARLELLRDDVARRTHGSRTAADNGQPPLPDVAERTASLQSDAERVSVFAAAVTETMELEAKIVGVLPAAEFEPVTPAELAAWARERERLIANQLNPSEEALRTRRVRLFYSLSSVRHNTEARLAYVQAQLASLQPTAVVPLAIDRDLSDTRPLTFTVRVVPSKATVTDVTSARHFFTLFHNGVAAGMPDIVTDVGVSPQASFSLRTQPGDYYVRVTRTETIGGAVLTTRIASAEASVRVFAACLRCGGTRFDVSSPRQFGECRWRTHPLNEAQRRELLGYQERAGRLGFVRVASDFVASFDDAFPVDDESLINLSIVDVNRLRALHFTYEGVVTKIRARVGDVAFRAAVLAACTRDVERAALASARTVNELPMLPVLRADIANQLKSERRFFAALQLRLRALEANDAVVTANDVATSEDFDAPATALVDVAGEERLRARLEHVRRRYNEQWRAIDAMEAASSSHATLLARELDAYENVGAPAGVSMDVWRRLVGATSAEDVAPPVLRLVDADWRGVHSSESAQPDLYTPANRGSERLHTGFDLDGLHSLIVAARVRADGGARARKLIDYYNVLAQFAPTLHARKQLSAAELVDRLDKVFV